MNSDTGESLSTAHFTLILRQGQHRTGIARHTESFAISDFPTDPSWDLRSKHARHRSAH